MTPALASEYFDLDDITNDQCEVPNGNGIHVTIAVGHAMKDPGVHKAYVLVKPWKGHHEEEDHEEEDHEEEDHEEEDHEEEDHEEEEWKFDCDASLNSQNEPDFITSLSRRLSRGTSGQVTYDYVSVARRMFQPFQRAVADYNTAVVRDSTGMGENKAVHDFTLKILDNFDDVPIDYLAEGILAAGEGGIICGPQKTCKTTIAADLTISLASKTKFLGRFKVPRRRKVLSVTVESREDTIKRIYKRVANSKGLDLKQLVDLKLSIIDDNVNLDNENHLRGIRKQMESGGYKVLILDPMSCMMPTEKEASQATTVQVLRKVEEICCRDFGATLIVVHHAKKNRSSGKAATFDDISWPGYSAWARQWMLLSRDEDYVVGSGSHELILSSGGSVEHQGLFDLSIEEGVEDESGKIKIAQWVTSVTDRTSTRTPAAKSSRRKPKTTAISAPEAKMLAVLKDYPEGQTLRKMGIGMNGEVRNKTRDSLLSKGMIEACRVGSEDGFKLALTT